MSYDVKCQACGKANPLGRLYCMGCGTKLEVSEATVARAHMRGSSGATSVVLRLIRLALSASLLAVIVLVLRPVAPEGRAGTLDDANELGRKLTDLRDATEKQRQVDYRIEEAEVNAYIAEMLKKSPPSATTGPLAFDLRGIQVALREGELVVLLVTEHAPITLTQEIRVVPVRQDERWTFVVKGMRMGRLPLPAALATKLAARSAGAFSSLAKEQALIEQLAVLDVKKGWVQTATSGL
jgi:hypothetical protein